MGVIQTYYINCNFDGCIRYSYRYQLSDIEDDWQIIKSSEDFRKWTCYCPEHHINKEK